jgi:hypothetical protein
MIKIEVAQVITQSLECSERPVGIEMKIQGRET